MGCKSLDSPVWRLCVGVNRQQLPPCPRRPPRPGRRPRAPPPAPWLLHLQQGEGGPGRRSPRGAGFSDGVSVAPHLFTPCIQSTESTPPPLSAESGTRVCEWVVGPVPLLQALSVLFVLPPRRGPPVGSAPASGAHERCLTSPDPPRGTLGSLQCGHGASLPVPRWRPGCTGAAPEGGTKAGPPRPQGSPRLAVASISLSPPRAPHKAPHGDV